MGYVWQSIPVWNPPKKKEDILHILSNFFKKMSFYILMRTGGACFLPQVKTKGRILTTNS